MVCKQFNGRSYRCVSCVDYMYGILQIRSKVMDNITSAEFICDLIAEKESLNFNDNMVTALCKARHETMCIHSPIGKHKCNVKINFMPQSGQESICVDTCLQNEIQDLIRKHRIWTVGSCCGHGVEQGFIQVAENCVEKMLELGYEPLALDRFGNGKNCFVPKTCLYTEVVCPVCNGKGEICVETSVNSTPPKTKKCEHCDGTGKREISIKSQFKSE